MRPDPFLVVDILREARRWCYVSELSLNIHRYLHRGILYTYSTVNVIKFAKSAQGVCLQIIL